MIATSPSILDLSVSICHREKRLFFQRKYKFVIVYFVPLTWYSLIQIKTYLDSLIRYILSPSSGNSVPEVHVCLFPSCHSTFTLVWSSWLHVMRKKQKPSAGHFAGGVSGVLDSHQLALVASAFSDVQVNGNHSLTSDAECEKFLVTADLDLNQSTARWKAQ